MKRWHLVVLGVTVVLGAVVVEARGGLSRGPVLGELAAARPARASSPLFSIPVEYRPCSVLRAEAGETVPRESCGADAGRLGGFEAMAVAGESSDPDSLQASALLALIGEDETEQAADAAITRLAKALRLTSRRVSVLVDLSGAHLVRAQRTQNPRDLLEGLNYALEAVEAEPRNRAARFNAALALQTLGLDEQAEIAWTEYLRIDEGPMGGRGAGAARLPRTPSDSRGAAPRRSRGGGARVRRCAPAGGAPLRVGLGAGRLGPRVRIQ
ncbi:MAG TPA: hypothetical protein VF584_23910 [Longimicrobium sp.]